MKHHHQPDDKPPHGDDPPDAAAAAAIDGQLEPTKKRPKLRLKPLVLQFMGLERVLSPGFPAHLLTDAHTLLTAVKRSRRCRLSTQRVAAVDAALAEHSVWPGVEAVVQQMRQWRAQRHSENAVNPGAYYKGSR